MSGHHLPHDTELVVQGRTAQWAVKAFTQALSGFAIVMSGFIICGGRTRFFGVSYEYALKTPGAPGSWAIALLLIGAASLVGTVLARPRVTAWAMFFGSWWSFFFAIAFALAAIEHPQASTTAPIAYFAFSVIFAISASVHGLRSPTTPPHSPAGSS